MDAIAYSRHSPSNYVIVSGVTSEPFSELFIVILRIFELVSPNSPYYLHIIATSVHKQTNAKFRSPFSFALNLWLAMLTG